MCIRVHIQSNLPNSDTPTRVSEQCSRNLVDSQGDLCSSSGIPVANYLSISDSYSISRASQAPLTNFSRDHVRVSMLVRDATLTRECLHTTCGSFELLPEDTGRHRMDAEAKIEQFVILAKSTSSNRALSDIVQRATSEPGIFAFGELSDLPNIKQVRISSKAFHG